MKTISLRKISIPDSVLRIVYASTAHRCHVLPLMSCGEKLSVAVSPDRDPLEAVDAIEKETGLTVEYLVADSKDDLELALKRYYPAVEKGKNGTASGLFELLLNRALQLRASDIHICPDENGADIQLRIDGRMQSLRHIDASTRTELSAVIKIAADLDIAEKRIPLDGSINMNLGDEKVSLRVATIPTIHGEHLTLRLLAQDYGETFERIDSLGMNAAQQRLFEETLNSPNGIILLSGPTGSGKTTTLYAALRYLRTKKGLHLISIEDPVEKNIDGVTQVKIDQDCERLTFNKALRSVLRHDPDIIMIGEIRDGETGDIAVKAALTGHLVLSTLHTNSAAGVLTRLENLGIAPFLVASTLRIAIAQRLVRTPCPFCMKKRRPTPEECVEFHWNSKDPSLQIPEPVGCSFCDGTGYAGRIGLYELIPIDDSLRKMILKNADEREIEKYVFTERGLLSLRMDGAAKILEGKTTIQEVRNVTNSILEW